MTAARLVRGGIAFATMGGALALGFASPASAAETGIPALEKIKQCESGGDYTAENPTSTASGAYQFIDGTFQSLSASQGYTHAADAPEAVQDAAAIELYNEQGTAPWAASASCWQAAGATGPASETNTGGTGGATSDDAPQAVTGGSGSSGASSSGSSYSGGTQVGGTEVDAPAQQAPVTQVPAQQAPVDQTPVDEVPAEQAPVDETPVGQTPVEQPAPSGEESHGGPVDGSSAEQSGVQVGGTQTDGGVQVGDKNC